jgi:hypothetical protein
MLKFISEMAHRRKVNRIVARVVHTDPETEIGVGQRITQPSDRRIIARLSDHALHRWLSVPVRPEIKIALERELRRREAWAAPAGKAFYISLAALGVSAVALAVSIFG